MEDGIPKKYTDLSGASRARPRARVSPTDMAKAAEREAKRKSLMNRLARIEGHVRSIQRMVDDSRNADEILTQVAAVKAALNKFSSVFISMELEECIPEASPNTDRLDRLTSVISTLLKQT